MGYYGGAMLPDGGATHTVPKTVPKPKPPKPKTVARPVSQGYNPKLPIKETTPYYGSGQLSYNQYQNVPAPKPKINPQSSQTRTAIANGVQVAGVNVPAAKRAITNVAAKQAQASGASQSNSSSSQVPATAAASPTTNPAAQGSTVGAAPQAAVAEPPAVPTTREVVIPDITIDPTYQQQVNDLAKQLTDAQTANTSSKNDYDLTYNNTLSNLGWDPGQKQFATNNNTTQYGSAFRSNFEDYAGRGIGQSSDYLQAMNDLNNVFSRQVGQLDTGRNSFRSAQDTALANFRSANTEAKSQALSEAAARVAASLGIDVSQVPTSGGKRTITVPITQPASS